MVSFIVPPPKIEEPPKPEPPAKLSPLRRPAAQPPVLTTKAIESPAPWTAPEPPKDPPPAPTEAPLAPRAAPLAPLTPPEFDAAYLRNPPPAYPPLSRRYREQGKVVLRVFVSAEGAAEKVEVQTSSGWPRLDAAGQEAVRAWRFVPARQGDKPVSAWVNVPINFKVEG